MDWLIALLIIVGIALISYLVYYVYTLPDRRRRAERLGRQERLYKQKLEAERTKRDARVAGAKTRSNIDGLAGKK